MVNVKHTKVFILNIFKLFCIFKIREKNRDYYREKCKIYKNRALSLFVFLRKEVLLC